jgi:hypothetical protein
MGGGPNGCRLAVGQATAVPDFTAARMGAMHGDGCAGGGVRLAKPRQRIDLPGFGREKKQSLRIRNSRSPGCCNGFRQVRFIGWSLGGAIALLLQRRPGTVPWLPSPPILAAADGRMPWIPSNSRRFALPS